MAIKHKKGGNYSQNFAPGVPVTRSLREHLIIDNPEDMPADIDQPDLKVTYEISPFSYEGISVIARKTLIRTPDEMIIWDIDAIEAAMKTQITKEHFEFKH